MSDDQPKSGGFSGMLEKGKSAHGHAVSFGDKLKKTGQALKEIWGGKAKSEETDDSFDAPVTTPVSAPVATTSSPAPVYAPASSAPVIPPAVAPTPTPTITESAPSTASVPSTASEPKTEVKEDLDNEIV